MENRSEYKSPLVDLMRSQREEIEKYRWIESEKAGRDIGWQRASEEWMRKYFPGWKQNVRARGVQPPLFEILWFQQQEIESYKWIESEKRGHDIGWKHAVTEWHDRHYGEWKEHVLTTTLDELRDTNRTVDGITSQRSTSKGKRPFSTKHRENLAVAMRAWHEKKKSGRSGSM